MAGYLPARARSAEKNISGEPFFGGAKLHVVDLKLHMAVRWFIGGKVGHIPATIFAGYRKLMGVHDEVVSTLRRNCTLLPGDGASLIDRAHGTFLTAR